MALGIGPHRGYRVQQSDRPASMAGPMGSATAAHPASIARPAPRPKFRDSEQSSFRDEAYRVCDALRGRRRDFTYDGHEVTRRLRPAIDDF